MRPAILLFLVAAALAAQTASIDGLVVNHATGQPIGGVHVRLLPAGAIDQIVDRIYGATSDKAGHFAIASMKAGVYQVSLERTGFVQVRTGPIHVVTLKGGQSLTGHKLEMDPRALILGRVLDEYGDPVQGIDVEARTAPGDPELDRILFGRAAAFTDDHGDFRILTAPGRYYIKASPQPPDDNAPPEIRTDGSVPAAYEATYYPSGAGMRTGSMVEAAPGQDVAGIEIHLRRIAAPDRVFTVSGQVTGAPEGARANVTLRIGSSPERLYNFHSAETGPDGKFSFSGLDAASYSVFARYSSGKAGLQSLPVDFQLDGSDRTDIQLNLVAGEELSGTVEIAGPASSTVAGEKRMVTLRLLDAYYDGVEMPSAETGKSGAFRFTNIHPGRYGVSLEPLPENAYVDSVSVDDTALDRSKPFGFIADFSRGVRGSKLKIVLSLAGAQISGKFIGHDGEPSESTCTCSVVIWKDTEDQPEEQQHLGDKAAFRINALRPGKYRIVAFDNLEMGDLFSNWVESLKLLRSAAQEIEVKKGDRIVRDLKVIGKEALHVNPK